MIPNINLITLFLKKSFQVVGSGVGGVQLHQGRLDQADDY
jgi:hypothetical protein